MPKNTIIQWIQARLHVEARVLQCFLLKKFFQLVKQIVFQGFFKNTDALHRLICAGLGRSWPFCTTPPTPFLSVPFLLFDFRNEESFFKSF